LNNFKGPELNQTCVLLVVVAALAGCVQPPKSPMEREARMAAAAELAAQRCGGYAGGYESVKRMKQDANRSVVTAKNLGATPEVMERARQDTQSAFTTAVVFTDQQHACNSLVSELAWNSN
jgi:hypothetical protein